MRTARRLVKDESGITMALAIIMILLLGVMGAGLLTFVSRDLNIVVEQNKGQRAFEVADAGIAAAKRQLASGVIRTNYDDPYDPPAPDDDIQWSAARGGLTLNNLDGDAATPDSVNVKIHYVAANQATGDPEHFLVVSEGTYGNAKRKIEGRFEGVVAGSGGGGQNIGHPVYYTPSTIKIVGPASLTAPNCNSPVSLNQVSLFSRQDILFQSHPACPVTNMTQFQSDYDDASGLIKVSNNDKLCDWNSKIPAGPNCFDTGMGGTGTWNTLSRTLQSPGLAAEGKICSVASAAINSCDSASSIADGVRGFDITTVPKFEVKPCLLSGAPAAATDCPDNETNKMSYPFPLPAPIPAGLKAAACAPPGTAAACTKTPPPVSYFTGVPTDPTWGLDTSNASNNRVAFIDAQNQTLTWDPGGGQYKGIIVVWCGRVEMNQNFEGIILNLVGNNLPGNTSCTKDTQTSKNGVLDGKSDGTYENKGYNCQCWVYAEGGSASTPGILLNPNSTLQFRPSQDWSFDNSLFQGPPPTSFAIRSWRELYQ